MPVSGGKDSTWQVVTCLEHDLHVLAVSWRTPVRTELGERNLENLIGLGVDHVDFSINPDVERQLMYQALTDHGALAAPMHLAIFGIPLTIATGFDVPLVVWGEDSAAEYVGEERVGADSRLDADWVRKYGAVQGTTPRDWISERISEQDLAPYFGPSSEELAKHGTEAVFLGHFFEWDPEGTARIAAEHGFEAARSPKLGYYPYADVDDEFIPVVHHWLKWHKFGFTRTYDNLSLEIRNGRLTRQAAIEFLRARGDETPWPEIESCCEYLGITREHFLELTERFRNPEIWSRRNDTWVIDGFLVPDWDWAAPLPAA